MSVWKIYLSSSDTFLASCQELKQIACGKSLTEVKEMAAEICQVLRDDGVAVSAPEFEHLTRSEARAVLDKQYVVR